MVFPVQATDKLFVWSTNRITELVCRNEAGIFFTVSLKEGFIDITHLPAGVYYLEIKVQDEQIALKRFVKM